MQCNKTHNFFSPYWGQMMTAETRHQATMLISAQTAENIYCVSPLPTQEDYISTVHQVRETLGVILN